jgi:hypothetical protein
VYRFGRRSRLLAGEISHLLREFWAHGMSFILRALDKELLVKQSLEIKTACEKNSVELGEKVRINP